LFSNQTLNTHVVVPVVGDVVVVGGGGLRRLQRCVVDGVVIVGVDGVVIVGVDGVDGVVVVGVFVLGLLAVASLIRSCG
jgi:hypothetical protein